MGFILPLALFAKHVRLVAGRVLGRLSIHVLRVWIHTIYLVHLVLLVLLHVVIVRGQLVVHHVRVDFTSRDHHV